MFNLVVRADENLPMMPERMLEGVPAEIAKRYTTATGYDLEELSKLPTVMMSSKPSRYRQSANDGTANQL